MLFKQMRLIGWAVLLLLFINSCSIVNANDCKYYENWDDLEPNLQDLIISHGIGTNLTLNVRKHLKIDICSKGSGDKKLAFSLNTSVKKDCKASFIYGDCEFDGVFRSNYIEIESIINRKQTDHVNLGYGTIVLKKDDANIITATLSGAEVRSMKGFCKSWDATTKQSFSANVESGDCKLELVFDGNDYEFPAAPTTLVPTTTLEPSSTSNLPSVNNPSKEASNKESADREKIESSSLSPVRIACLVLGILAIVALLGVGAFFLFRCYRKRDRKSRKGTKKAIIKSTAIPIEEDGDLGTAVKKSNASEKSSKRIRNEQSEDKREEAEKKPSKDSQVPFPQANVPEPKKDGAYDDYEPVGRMDLSMPPPPLPDQ